MRRYLEVLRTPGGAAAYASGLVGRLPISMLALALLLLVEDLTGSYARAGVAAAVGGVGQAAGLPLLGRLADRVGHRRTVLPALAGHLLGLLVIGWTAATGGPYPVLLLGAVLAGAALPPLGSLVRARWAATLPGGRLPAAFALEAVGDELVFVTGPLLVTALAVGVDPLVALASLTVPVTLGTLVYASLPLPRGAGRDPHPELLAGAGASVPAVGVHRPRALAGSGPKLLVAALLPLGLTFGALEVSVVAVTDALGSPGSAGVVLALVAGTSGVSGLAYGARTWRAPLALRLSGTLLALGAATLVMTLAAGDLGALHVAAVLVGAGVAPSLVAAFELAQGLADPGARTEAIAWANTGITLGAALGAAAAGPLVDVVGPTSGLVLAGSASVAAGSLVAVARGRLALPGERRTEPSGAALRLGAPS